MKVLWVAKVDIANAAYNYSECLNLVGIDSSALKTARNPRRNQQAPFIKSSEQLINAAQDADIIIWLHSQYTHLEVDLSDKVLGVLHGGTRYRRNIKRTNALFNPRVQISFIKSPSGVLLGKGAKNEKWIFPVFDTDNIKPRYRKGRGPLKIGHFPTSKKRKGTAFINETIRLLKKDPEVKDFEYAHGTGLISWKKNLERVADCDIYIDNIYLGGWGNSTIEAAGLGTIPVTDFKMQERYKKEYGEHPLVIITRDSLYSQLKMLLSETDDVIRQRQYKARQWVEDFHSYIPTGNRLRKDLESVYKQPLRHIPQTPKEPIRLTVILPMFRAKYIGWLPLEGLIAQKGIDFKWELIIAEEVNDEPFGADAILAYKQRLENVGCVNLKYIGLQKWIPLAQKWTMLAKMAAETSEVLCGHPADYYAAPNKLARHMEVFSNPDIVWHQPRRMIHYLIRDGNMILQDATNASRKDNVIGKAMCTRFLRDLPDSMRRTGFDGWLIKRYRRLVKESKAEFKTKPDFNDDYRYAISTIGFNNISPKTRLPRIGKGLIYTEYTEDLRQYIPPFIIDKLEASREFLPKHKRGLPQNRIGK